MQISVYVRQGEGVALHRHQLRFWVQVGQQLFDWATVDSNATAASAAGSGLGFRVQGLGFRVQGLGFRV